MLRSFKYTAVAACAALVLLGSAAVAALPTIMEEKNILPYLEKMISWQRAGAALEISPELPRTQIMKNTFQQHSIKVLNDSFAFAQAVADTLPPPAAKPEVVEEKIESASRKVGLRHAVRMAETRIQQLQEGLSKARTRAARDKANGALRLAQEHLTLLKALAETVGAQEEGDDTLARKINQLASTVSSLESEQKKAESTDAALPAAAVDGTSSGIIGLATRVYGFMQAKSTVKSLLNDTKTLLNNNKDRSQTIRDAVKGIMEAGATAGAPIPVKPGLVGPVQQPPTYDSLVGDMKKLSKIAVAMGAMNQSLSTCIRDLSAWVEMIAAHIKELLSELVFRCTMLLLAICVALGLSALARKATRRYVIDRRRKDQLRIVRKATLMISIVIILFLGFFTDLNSLATFAGLLTAGVAFATKDMILSVFAYFQFFGSSDIRVGDDVSIGGVSGKITHIGMLRFYMMETQKSDIGFLPTGRIVGFANSVLFQPTPFFRQTSGTNFVWNEIDILLSPTIDHATAYQKLNAIVQKAYAKQQEVIRRSETALQKTSTLKLEISVPQTYFKFTNVGVAFAIRYAVEREQAQKLHLHMMTELLTAMKTDPELRALHVTSSGLGQPVAAGPSST